MFQVYTTDNLLVKANCAETPHWQTLCQYLVINDIKLAPSQSLSCNDLHVYFQTSLFSICFYQRQKSLHIIQHTVLYTHDEMKNVINKESLMKCESEGAKEVQQKRSNDFFFSIFVL